MKTLTFLCKYSKLLLDFKIQSLELFLLEDYNQGIVTRGNNIMRNIVEGVLNNKRPYAPVAGEVSCGAIVTFKVNVI